MHPGHTPYFNLEDWDQSMTMGSPSKLFANAYPANFKSSWPIDEGYFNTKYVWAHNEFTPQQTMRGKMALYEVVNKARPKSSPVRTIESVRAEKSSKIIIPAKAFVTKAAGGMIQWFKKPNFMQFNAGRVEISLPVQAAIII